MKKDVRTIYALLIALGAIVSFIRFVPQVHAAITLVVATSTTGFNPTSQQINTTGADLYIVCVRNYNSAGVSSTITDNMSNVWSFATSSPFDGGLAEEMMYYAINPNTSSTQTFSSNPGAGQTYGMTEAAFSGVAVSSPLDHATGANNAATTVQPGSITPSQSNELFYTCLQTDGGAPLSIDSGFVTSTAAVAYVSSINYAMQDAYLVQAGITAQNPTWTNNSSANLSAVMATFKVASSSAPITPPPLDDWLNGVIRIVANAIFR